MIVTIEVELLENEDEIISNANDLYHNNISSIPQLIETILNSNAEYENLGLSVKIQSI